MLESLLSGFAADLIKSALKGGLAAILGSEQQHCLQRIIERALGQTCRSLGVDDDHGDIQHLRQLLEKLLETQESAEGILKSALRKNSASSAEAVRLLDLSPETSGSGDFERRFFCIFLAVLEAEAIKEARKSDSSLFNLISLEYSSIIVARIDRILKNLDGLNAYLKEIESLLTTIPNLIDISIRGKRLDTRPFLESRVREFIEDYVRDPDGTNPFGGREPLMKDLDEWLDSEEKPNWRLVYARAGRGKSALLVNWVLRHADSPNWHLIFVPISIRARLRTAYDIYRILYERLAPLSNEKPDIGTAPDIEDYRAEVAQLLKSLPSTDTRILLVFDGLDEAENTEVLRDILPPLRSLAPHLKVLVSARMLANFPNPEKWLNTLKWPNKGKRGEILEVPLLGRDEIRDVLLESGMPVSVLAEKNDIVKKLEYLTSGEPLLVNLYIRSLRSTPDEPAELRPEELANMAPGLGGFFEKWFDDQKKVDPSVLNYRDTCGIFYILAYAKGPLQQGELSVLLDRLIEKRERNSAAIIERLARFLYGSHDVGYSFSHPAMAYFFTQPNYEDRAARFVEIDLKVSAESVFLDWAHEVIADYDTTAFPSEQLPRYLLENLVSHVIEDKTPPDQDDLQLILSNSWRLSHFAADGHYYRYDFDVSRVHAAYVDFYSNLAPKDKTYTQVLTDHMRCVLIRSSIRTQGDNISVELIRQILSLHPTERPMSERQILGQVGLFSDTKKAVRALVCLCGLCSEHLKQGILDAVRAISDDDAKAQALTGLAAHLPPDLRQDALDAAQVISNDRYKAQALTGLAAHLPPDLMPDALNAAKAISDDRYKAQALTGLAAHLPPDLMPDALDAAQAISNDYYKAQTLTGLAAHLEEDLKQQVIKDALDAARVISDCRYMAEALTGLAAHLKGDLRQQAIKDALDAAQAISHDYYKAWVITGLAAHLVEGQIFERLATFSRLPRPQAISGLATLVTGSDREGQRQVASAAASAISEVTQAWRW